MNRGIRTGFLPGDEIRQESCFLLEQKGQEKSSAGNACRISIDPGKKTVWERNGVKKFSNTANEG